MAEYIEREAAYKRLMNNKKWAHSPSDMEYAAELVLTVPAADVVEVVRCKDCQYAKPYERNDGKTGYYCQHQNCTFVYGTNWERLFEPIKEANDFCSFGEKMDGKGEGE